MLVRPPNSILYEEGFWDELADAGIDAVALQWLAVLDEQGGEQTRFPQIEDVHPRALAAVCGEPVQRTPVSAYDPDPALYEGLSWPVPQMPPHLFDEGKRLSEAIQMGVARGFTVYCMDDKGYFLAGGFGSGKLEPTARRVSFCDPEVPAMAAARARDTLANFPEFSGILLDGPDYKWEIRPGHRDDMWVEVLDDEFSRQFAEERSISMQRVLDGRDRFQERLQSLSPAAVDDFVHNRAGAFSAAEWWLEEPDVVEWMRFKFAAIEWHLSSEYFGIKEHLPDLDVLISARAPVIAPLCGHNLRRRQAYSDFQVVRQYWWSGGVAGIKGTVVDWVDTLVEWNPGLSPEEAASWFSAAFDYPMPSDYPPSAYDEEATDEWFATSVRDQTRKMLAATGGPEKLIPAVGLEHFGSNWLSATELRRLLAEMQSQGITRYQYFVYNSIKPEIWDVITDFSRP